MKKYEAVFFDLDGTIIDSGEGVSNSVLYALKKFGIDETREKALLYCTLTTISRNIIHCLY